MAVGATEVAEVVRVAVEEVKEATVRMVVPEAVVTATVHLGDQVVETEGRVRLVGLVATVATVATAAAEVGALEVKVGRVVVVGSAVGMAVTVAQAVARVMAVVRVVGGGLVA